MRQRKLKTIWAVDLFEDADPKRSQLITVLRYLAEKQNAEIEPVYVLSPEGLDLAVEFSPPWIKQYKPAALKSLRLALKDVQIPGLLDARILLQAKPSLSFMVKSLIRYAKLANAELIVMGTHSRKGISRLFLGSFAESTLLYARVPVMVVGPHSESKEFKKILFATDFGDKSNAIFQKVLALAQDWDAQVTIFHSVAHPIEPVIQAGGFLLGGGWIDLPEYMTQVEAMNRKQAERWATLAEKQGVAAKVVFFPSGGSVSQSIVDYAQNNEAGLIAMTAESGPLASTLIGSISRQVVRNAHCPVWVFRA
ncbi:MAG: universal stress protein [Bdellovibrionia bacterium]